MIQRVFSGRVFNPVDVSKCMNGFVDKKEKPSLSEELQIRIELQQFLLLYVLLKQYNVTNVFQMDLLRHCRVAVHIIVPIRDRPSSSQSVDKHFIRGTNKEDRYCRCISKSPKFSRNL